MNANAPAFVPGGQKKNAVDDEERTRTPSQTNPFGKNDEDDALPPPLFVPPLPTTTTTTTPPPSVVNISPPRARSSDDDYSNATMVLAPSPPRKLSQDVLMSKSAEAAAALEGGTVSSDDDEESEEDAKAARMTTTKKKKKEETSEIPKYDLKKHFKTVLPLGPALTGKEGGEGATDGVLDKLGVEEGILPNGLRYFIGQCKKPENRAALALAVDVGSVLRTRKSEASRMLSNT